MIFNKYKSLFYRIKGPLERLSPRLFEEYVMPLSRRVMDIVRRPEILRFIEKKTKDGAQPSFHEVQIETINRCNAGCSFCPVNRESDTRTLKIMEESLFLSIIEQLREIDYSEMLSLFSNNEPLMDKRLARFCKIAKEALPKARLTLMTNGSLLTIEKLVELMKHVDYLVIDNYNDDLALNKPVKAVYDYCMTNELYKDKVLIQVRKENEVLSTRAGNAPNRTKIEPLRSPCIAPFFQIVIRPDGKVSLCCNDALGEMTMGDVAKERIVDVWNGEGFRDVRKKLMQGRGSIGLCSSCDAYV